MQLDGGRRGSAQHILEWGVFGLVFRRKAGFLLLEDRQSQHVAEREQAKDRKHTNEHARGQKTQAECRSSFKIRTGAKREFITDKRAHKTLRKKKKKAAFSIRILLSPAIERVKYILRTHIWLFIDRNDHLRWFILEQVMRTIFQPNGSHNVCTSLGQGKK